MQLPTSTRGLALLQNSQRVAARLHTCHWRKRQQVLPLSTCATFTSRSKWRLRSSKRDNNKPFQYGRSTIIRDLQTPSRSNTKEMTTTHSGLELPFPVFRDVPLLRELRQELAKTGKQVALVPTMGALHEGHLSLVRHALRENDHCFVSIFVNPTQFGVNEDLGSYPKTWAADMARLMSVQKEFDHTGSKICGIFAPTVDVMYPTAPPSSEIDGEGSFVTITPLGKWLEGETRPVFFRGVATICTKLFNIVQPERVYFGQKDVQQSVLIKKMIKDFHIPIQVRVIATSRESDGLAMSSRNVYLGDRRRKDVGVLSHALLHAVKIYEQGELSARQIRMAAFSIFDQELRARDGSYFGQGKIDIVYISLNNSDDMAAIGDDERLDPRKGAILSAAIKVWPVDQPRTEEEKSQIAVRLIDNVILEPKNYQ